MNQMKMTKTQALQQPDIMMNIIDSDAVDKLSQKWTDLINDKICIHQEKITLNDYKNVYQSSSKH